MQTALMVLGYIVAVAFSVFVVATGIALVINATRRLLDRFEDRIEMLERRRVGESLRSAAWWFSEDRDTLDLLTDFATELQGGSRPLEVADSVREAWRARRKAQNKDAA